MTTALIDDFCRIYQGLNKNNLNQLELVYSENINFIDALHNLKGLDQLSEYFNHLYAHLLYCNFTIEEVIRRKARPVLFGPCNMRIQKLIRVNLSR